jgi:aldose 1-epimerase
MAKVDHYGNLDGRHVEAVTLEAGPLRARLITYGARLTELWVPGRDGTPADIVLGHDTLEQYRATKTYFGATAGRYANRIREGRFRLNGADLQLDRNEGANHLHGGTEGLDRQVWTLADTSATWATLTLASPDGDMGYPGRLDATVTYELSGDGLRVIMAATTDRPTIVNIVHHSYFNLAGQGQGDVLAQEMRLDAPFYTPVDGELLTTGEILSVQGTPFDFTTPKPIGRDIDRLAGVGGAVFGEGGGYDHNWCLNGAGEDLRLAAEIRDPASGRRLTLRTTEPGVQVYTGGYLEESVIGKGGVPYRKFGGFTLETQKFPGTPNHAHFPPCTLHPGQTYRHEMVFGLSAD